MAFEATIVCDSDTCNSRMQVPQTGTVPGAWISMRYVKPKVSEKGKAPEMEPVTLNFCSWKCAMHYAQTKVKELALQ